MNQPAGITHSAAPLISDLARCLSCRQPLMGEDRCGACRRVYPFKDGFMEAIGPLSGRNRIVADF